MPADMAASPSASPADIVAPRPHVAVIDPATGKNVSTNQALAAVERALDLAQNKMQGSMDYSVQLARVYEVWLAHPESGRYANFQEFASGVLGVANPKKKLMMGRICRFLLKTGFAPEDVSLIAFSETLHRVSGSVMKDLPELNSRDGDAIRLSLWYVTFVRAKELFEQRVRRDHPDIPDREVHSKAMRAKYFKRELLEDAAKDACTERVCVRVCMSVCSFTVMCQTVILSFYFVILSFCLQVQLYMRKRLVPVPGVLFEKLELDRTRFTHIPPRLEHQPQQQEGEKEEGEMGEVICYHCHFPCMQPRT